MRFPGDRAHLHVLCLNLSCHETDGLVWMAFITGKLVSFDLLVNKGIRCCCATCHWGSFPNSRPWPVLWSSQSLSRPSPGHRGNFCAQHGPDRREQRALPVLLCPAPHQRLTGSPEQMPHSRIPHGQWVKNYSDFGLLFKALELAFSLSSSGSVCLLQTEQK